MQNGKIRASVYFEFFTPPFIASLQLPPGWTIWLNKAPRKAGSSGAKEAAMRRRLYFVLPDVPSAEQTLRDLLLARIEVGHIHCLAKRELPLGELPEANFLQKTDIVHGATSGLAIGGIAGIVAGILVVLFPPGGHALQLVTVLIAGIAGAAFGAWVASMAGTALPNSQLKVFQAAIESGAVLMMVDVPFVRAGEIRDLVTQRHPEAISGGTEPSLPAFP